MSEVIADPIRAVVETVYRSDSRRVLATLIRLLGDFDLAEEALHGAFAAAVAPWRPEGIPDETRPCPARVQRDPCRAIDAQRGRAGFDRPQAELADRLTAARDAGERDDEGL